MNSIIVALKDKKADGFHQPYVVPNEALAIRAFGDAVQHGDNDLSKHKEDFSLFKVGEFDYSTGKIKPVAPVEICSGLDFNFTQEEK